VTTNVQPTNYSHSDGDFQRSIDENPHDSTRHWVYADWLDENGRSDEAAWKRIDGALANMQLRDHGGFLNGSVMTHLGNHVRVGGGIVHDDQSANSENEAAGIAGGMRQGVWYPNQTSVGDFEPYEGHDNGYLDGLARDTGIDIENDHDAWRELVDRVQEATMRAYQNLRG